MKIQTTTIIVTALLATLTHVTSYDLYFVTGPENPRARLVSPNPSVLKGLDQFSACMHVNIKDGETNSVSLISYSSIENYQSNELLLACEAELSTALYIGGEKVTFDIAPASGQWAHICVTCELLGDVNLYIDGELVGTQPAPEYVIQLGGNGPFEIGQDQDDPEYPIYDLDDGMQGLISRFHFWNKILSKNEVLKVSQCESGMGGNLINWHNSTWNFLGNLIPRTSTVDPPCDGEPCGSVVKDEVSTCAKVETAPYDQSAGSPLLKEGEKTIIVATLDNKLELPEFDQLSVCFWFYHGRGGRPSIEAFVLKKDNVKYISYRPYAPELCLSIKGEEIECYGTPQTRGTWAQGTWVHHCFIWPGEGEPIQEYADGDLVGATYLVTASLDTIPDDTKMVVRQVQTEPADESNSTKGFVMKITDVNLFSWVLSKDEVQSIIDCRGAIPGAPVNWGDSVFKVSSE